MHWIVASLLSAFVLGCYELSTKHAVRDNAVLVVLFFTNVCSALVWLALMTLDSVSPGTLPPILHVPPLNATQHLLLLAKSALVAFLWTCSYFAVKHLPVSLASPIRSTSPVFTLTGALFFLGERPSLLEGVGIAITLGSFFGLSAAGAREGIHFGRNRWVWLLVFGTALNGVSALYDKYLLGYHGFSAASVQAWFSIYLALLFLPLAVGWKLRLWQRNEFHWRSSIVFMSLALLVADFLYFDALRNPDALISVVSSFRRGSTLVAFAGGIWLLGEKNWRQKLPAVLGVLLGIVLTILG